MGAKGARALGKSLLPRRLRPLAKRVYYAARPPGARIADLARRCDSQAAVCRRNGSPFYAALLTRAAEDVRAGGPTRTIMASAPATRSGADDALALQLMGAVHRLVLEGRLPALAAEYPSTGGSGDPEAAWPLLREALEREREAVTRLFHHAVQTNEVGRCPLLASAFHLVARETGLPLRLLEIGASAGLNLLWDAYRYELGGEPWGDPASPVRFTEPFLEGAPAFWAGTRVAERAGCDVAPIDPATEQGRLELLSYVWPDQARRLEHLRGALEVAARSPVHVAAEGAAPWLERLTLAQPGVATVVYHSFVEQFFDDDTRARLRRTLAAAAAAATPESPVAHLRMEWGREVAETRLTVWPRGEERLLATSTVHGHDVRWVLP